jgi:hypothetical protein
MITVINFICNLILGGCLTMFYLYLYGDNDKIVHRWSFIRHWTLKFGIIGIILGTLYNMFTLDTPHLSQVVLNLGLTLVFVWAYLFHKKMFQQKLDGTKKI